MGYNVKINDPYKGVELVRAFSEPKAHRHSLQVEVNRRLYMDERTRERNSGFRELETNLAKLLSQVAAYAQERGSHVCEAHGHDHGHHHHGHHHHGHHPHGHGHDHDHGHAHDSHEHGHGGHRHEH